MCTAWSQTKLASRTVLKSENLVQLNIMQNDLTKKIEAILFYSGEPVKINSLVKILESTKEDISTAISELQKNLENRGVKIVEHEGEVSLVTAPELASIIEKMIKEERERDLGRAGIETLSIIAYKGPVSKKEIEYIRGVNSQYALRNLLLRGLIERKSNEQDERTSLYTVTHDTLRFLGLNKISDLPEYNDTQKQLDVMEEIEEENNAE